MKKSTPKSGWFAAAALLWLWAVPVHAEQKMTVVASFSILADMAENIGGNKIEVISLVGANEDAHVYQPKPRDLKTLLRAELLLINGLHFEPWIDRLIESTGFIKPVVVASSGVDTLTTGGNGAELDPHAWQSVPNAKIYVANILAALLKADPNNRDVYRANAHAYNAALDKLESEIRTAIAALPDNRKTIVTSHDAFGYFGQAYGLQFLAPLGMNTEQEASARDIVNLITQIREHKITAVFVESITDTRLLEQVARETGASIGGTLYSDALSTPEEGADTYIRMVHHNLYTLTQALR